MTANSTTDLFEALAEQARLRTEVRNRRDAVGAIQKRQESARHDVARAGEHFNRDAMDDVVNELPIRENTRLRDKIVRGEGEIAACKAALPAAVDAAKAAEAALIRHDRVVAAAALGVTASAQADALEKLSRSIGNLHEPLAALAASAIVRERLLGDRFANPRGVEVIGGRQLAAALIESLPARLRPQSLNVKAIELRAQEIAETHLINLQPQESQNV